MNEEERYEQVDMPFYKEVIAPILPETVCGRVELQMLRLGFQENP